MVLVALASYAFSLCPSIIILGKHVNLLPYKNVTKYDSVSNPLFLFMQRTGPEVIKLFSSSAQLSMNFQLLINTK